MAEVKQSDSLFSLNLDDEMGVPVDRSVGATLHPSKTCNNVARCVLDNRWFCFFVAFINVANCLQIGRQTDCAAVRLTHNTDPPAFCDKNADFWFWASEIVVVIVFTIDLLLHILVSWRYLLTTWGVFDFITIAGSMSYVLYVPVASFNALRICRLLRLGRNIGLIIHVPEIYTMVQGFFGAFKAVFFAFVLAFMLIFTFAIIGVEAFSSAQSEWSRVGRAMEALVRIATYDSWNIFVEPMYAKYPIWARLYVLLFIWLVAVTLLSLVTAIITERSFTSAAEDQEIAQEARNQRLQRAHDELMEIMKRADTNQDGDISKTELRTLWGSNNDNSADLKTQAFLSMFGNWEDIEFLFDFMCSGDAKRSTVSYSELIKGAQLYKQDKTSFFGTVTVRNLVGIRRRIMQLEHTVHSARIENREVSTNPVVSKRLAAEKRARHHEDKEREVRLLHRTNTTVDVQALRRVFELCNSSCTGLLSEDEFWQLWKETARATIGHLWRIADIDRSGQIDFDEFVDMVHKIGWQRFRGLLVDSYQTFVTGALEEVSVDVTFPTGPAEMQTHDTILKDLDSAITRASNEVISQVGELLNQHRESLSNGADLRAAAAVALEVERGFQKHLDELRGVGGVDSRTDEVVEGSSCGHGAYSFGSFREQLHELQEQGGVKGETTGLLCRGMGQGGATRDAPISLSREVPGETRKDKPAKGLPDLPTLIPPQRKDMCVGKVLHPVACPSSPSWSQATPVSYSHPIRCMLQDDGDAVFSASQQLANYYSFIGSPPKSVVDDMFEAALRTMQGGSQLRIAAQGPAPTSRPSCPDLEPPPRTQV